MKIRFKLPQMLLVWIVLQSSTITAQTMFQKNFGTGQIVVGEQTSDGGYMLAGYQVPAGAIYGEFFLAKMDSFSDISWANTYSTGNVITLFDAIQTNDGGYMLAGSTRINSAVYNMLFVKTDANGDTAFTCTYYGNAATTIIQTADGGYLAGGQYTDISNSTGMYILKMDANGDSLWSMVINTQSISNNEVIRDIIPTNDGGYMISGEYDVLFSGADCYLLKIDSSGIIQWHKTYGSVFNDRNVSVQQTTDGGFIMGGNSVTFTLGYNQTNLFLIRTNSIGDTLWTAAYGEQGLDEGGMVRQTPDGGFIIAGYTVNSVIPGNAGYLIKTDAAGLVNWSKAYGELGYDNFLSIRVTSDSGYIATGGTSSFVFGTNYVVKTDASGNSNCSENAMSTLVYKQPISVGTSILTVTHPQAMSTNMPVTIGLVGGTLNTPCFTTTSNNEFSIDNDKISLTPNPAASLTVLEYRSNAGMADYITITNLQGRTIQSHSISPSQNFKFNLDISVIENGIYTVNIFSKQKLLKSTNLIKTE